MASWPLIQLLIGLVVNKVQPFQLLDIYRASLLTIGALVGLCLLLALSVRGRQSRMGDHQEGLTGTLYALFLTGIVSIEGYTDRTI